MPDGCSDKETLAMERPIGLEHLFTITFFAPNLNPIGDTPHGKRFLANVDGGHFQGPRMKGTVHAPAGDWLLIRNDNSVQLDVRCSLVTDDDVRIFMSYQGLRVGEQSVLDRMAAGEEVDPNEYYMRTICRFETGDEKYYWLNHLLAVGTGQRFPERVVYDVHQII